MVKDSTEVVLVLVSDNHLLGLIVNTLSRREGVAGWRINIPLAQITDWVKFN